MPLFSYECNKCECVVEKFVHKSSDIPELKCRKCDGIGFKKLFSDVKSRIGLDAKTLYETKIKPDVQRIMKNISNGKDSDFLDISGD